MAVQSIIPYLNFDGAASEAIAFYEHALGAETVSCMKFGDMEQHPHGEEANDRVMHAELRLGEASVMVSDGPPGYAVPQQSNVHVSLQFDDLADMKACWAKATAGGEVAMELSPAFWGATFGMFKDKFGISWMFNGPAA